MRKFTIPVTAALAGILATAAFAQDTPQRDGMMHMTPMQGQKPEQAGKMMDGCPMMQRAAAMEQRCGD